MFPNDSSDPVAGDHDADGEDGKCLGCGYFHGDLSQEVAVWLGDISGGFISTWQVLTAFRGLITQLRQLVPADLAILLLAREVHLIEDYLRDNDYTVAHSDGTRIPFMTAEVRAERVNEWEEILENGIPDFIPDDLGGDDEQ